MILIVDDKQENLFSLKTLLQLHAYEVDTASSGEEALKKILKNEYALIILDVQMPGMDGYEVAETVTGYSKTKNIPIIFLSAVNIDKRFITKGYASGGVDYITKPFDPDLLLLKVQTFYKLYEQTRSLQLIQEALKEANHSLEDKVKERTKELLQMNKDLEQSNVELQQYASVASHDLQEPLRKIITFSNVIWEKFLENNAEAKPYMKKIISSTERMRNLINDLLNYSKLSSVSQFEKTDLNQILNETLSDLELSIQEKKAKVVVENLPSAEVIPGQIRQVFQNIISNALKFSKRDMAPVIRVWGNIVTGNSVESNSAFGESVRICIGDNGIGFDQKYLEKIFVLFQRLHGKSEYDGTGIGLAIVKKIIEKHNGSITAESKEGEGARFIIILPLKQKIVRSKELQA
jgi:signal transduction histidine kinase